MSLSEVRRPRQSLAGIYSAMVHGFRRSHRDWDALPVKVIDEIVTKLRQTQRWRRDGPVLRLLNRHWSNQIDKNIRAIRPHSDIRLHAPAELAYVSRKLTEADTASLLKYKNLTALDLMPFLVNFERFIPEPGTLNRQAVRVIQKQKDDIERVFRILSCLPCLTHVDVPESVLKFQLRFCWRGGLVQWKRLASMSSLRFYKLFERITTSDELHAVEPYQQAHGLTEWEVEGLCALMEELPDVTTLEFTVNAQHTPSCVTTLQRLEHLKLNVSVQSSFLDDLPQWLPQQARLAVNVTTTCTLSNALDSLSNLENLPQLQSLTFWYVLDCWSLMSLSFASTLQNLVTLQLEAVASYVQIPVDFFSESLSLAHLSLRNFEFDGDDLFGRLPELTTLTLTSCRVRNGIGSLMHMKKLEELYLFGTLAEEAPRVYASITPASLAPCSAQLKRLGMTDISHDDVISDLVKLSNLEYLSVDTFENVSVQAIGELEKLPDLRHLRVSHPRGNEMLWSFFALTFLTHLERLSFDVTFTATERLEACVQKLEKKAPHLRVD